MKIFQPLCVAVLALSAYAGNVAASAPAVSDDSLAFNNMTDNPTWETPDLPYARLLTQHTTLNATPRWLNAGTRQSALAPPTTTAAARPAVQQPNVPPPVPEASMVSMLLVGLGLLALSMHGEKQEKFDG